jgi:adenine-specific DNA-methyltransferase
MDVPAPHARRNFEFYEAKDRRMTEESSVGLMLWDGKSKGTLSNVHRLLDAGKKVVLWIAPEKKFRTLKSVADWQKLAGEKQHLPQAPSTQEPIWR